MGGVVGIREVVVDGHRHIHGIGTTAIGFVGHVDRHAAVVHQHGHGLFLFRCRSTGAIGLKHIGPVVGGLAEVGVLLTVARRVIAVFTCALGRPFPIFHELCHGGGDASRGAAARGIHVVGGVLVPFQLHQKIHNGSASVEVHHAMLFEVLPAGEDSARCSMLLCRKGLDASHVLTHHKEQAIGGCFIIEIALVGIAEDGRRQVVGRHDDEAAVEIEGIGACHAAFGAEGVGQVDVLHVVLGKHGLMLDKVQSKTLGLGHIDGLGLKCDDAQQQGKDDE